MTIAPLEIFLRLIVIIILAGLIGLEREYHSKPAGLRTNVMVGLGSALMTIASIRILDLFPGIVSADPTRIIAQIITGIGFIGAGVIMQSEKGNVIGLTTAASLWVVSGLGIAVGMGLYYEAIITTILVLCVFAFFGRRVIEKIRQQSIIRTIESTSESMETEKNKQE